MTVTLRRLHRLVLLVLAASALLALGAGPASAASSTQLLRDCQDGSLSGRYSQADYAKALRDIPTDVDEYTDCRGIIRNAELGAAGSSSGSGSNAGPAAGAGGGGTTSGTGGGSAGASAAGANGDPSSGIAASTANGVLADATPQERAAVAAAAGGAGAPVRLASATVRPQDLVTGAGLPNPGLPTSLVVSLIGLGLVAIFALGWRTKSLVDARRTVQP